LTVTPCSGVSVSPPMACVNRVRFACVFHTATIHHSAIRKSFGCRRTWWPKSSRSIARARRSGSWKSIAGEWVGCFTKKIGAASPCFPAVCSCVCLPLLCVLVPFNSTLSAPLLQASCGERPAAAVGRAGRAEVPGVASVHGHARPRQPRPCARRPPQGHAEGRIRLRQRQRGRGHRQADGQGYRVLASSLATVAYAHEHGRAIDGATRDSAYKRRGSEVRQHILIQQPTQQQPHPLSPIDRGIRVHGRTSQQQRRWLVGRTGKFHGAAQSRTGARGCRGRCCLIIAAAGAPAAPAAAFAVAALLLPTAAVAAAAASEAAEAPALR
jgi:hypothetical protein